MGAAPISFPRIQGADVCGEIATVGQGVNAARIGERVISDNWLRDPDTPGDINKTGYFGSERIGGFAEYTTMPTQNTLVVNSNVSDAELATFSCSTVIPPSVTQALIRHIEARAIQPALAATLALSELHTAQTAFIEKKHTGNLVVVP
jgi:NADPH:quinone reductase-like Zn-dependent oxidoreductase